MQKMEFKRKAGKRETGKFFDRINKIYRIGERQGKVLTELTEFRNFFKRKI